MRTLVETVSAVALEKTLTPASLARYRDAVEAMGSEQDPERVTRALNAASAELTRMDEALDEANGG